MKILPINQNSNYKNINCKGINNTCKIGMGLLITSSSFFMLSNAIDSFEQDDYCIQKSSMNMLDITASIAGIFGTFTSLIGLKQDEEDEENSRRNRY